MDMKAQRIENPVGDCMEKRLYNVKEAASGLIGLGFT